MDGPGIPQPIDGKTTKTPKLVSGMGLSSQQPAAEVAVRPLDGVT